jgi:hypothetical protein
MELVVVAPFGSAASIVSAIAVAAPIPRAIIAAIIMILVASPFVALVIARVCVGRSGYAGPPAIAASTRGYLRIFIVAFLWWKP